MDSGRKFNTELGEELAQKKKENETQAEMIEELKSTP